MEITSTIVGGISFLLACIGFVFVVCSISKFIDKRKERLKKRDDMEDTISLSLIRIAEHFENLKK